MKFIIPEDSILPFLKNTASVVKANGNNFYFMPFWFEDIGYGKLQAHHLSKLPEPLKSKIIYKRNICTIEINGETLWFDKDEVDRKRNFNPNQP